MKFKNFIMPVAMLASFTLAVTVNADDHAADVYRTNQLNTKQELKPLILFHLSPQKLP